MVKIICIHIDVESKYPCYFYYVFTEIELISQFRAFESKSIHKNLTDKIVVLENKFDFYVEVLLSDLKHY